jgi:folate-dependent phosphoribosylglycinamide formyltransferase PurN
MKIALLSKVVCPLSQKVIEYFEEQNIPVQCVIIEKNYRLKFSESEISWKKARNTFHRKKRNYPSFKWILKKCWYFLPRSVKKYIYIHIYNIPLMNEISIRKYCETRNVQFFEVTRHSSVETKKLFEEMDIDYVLMISSNWLLKEPIISLPKPRIINAHPGWLPKHRGMDPIGWSLIENDPVGITTHFIDAGIDSGEILRFYKAGIESGDNLQTIAKKVIGLQPFVFYDTLKGLERNEIHPQKQEKLYTLHRPLTCDELCNIEAQLALKCKSNS